MTPALAQSESPEYQAIIGAPDSVELANTAAITIMVDFHRVNTDSISPAPAKILLVTTNGRWVKDSIRPPEPDEQNSPQEIEVDTTPYPCTATLLLNDASDLVPLRVEVFLPPANTGVQPVSLGSKAIALRYPALIKFLAVPETVPADGRTTSAISLRLFNDVGQGIRNSSFALLGNGPPGNLDLVVGGVTDNSGRVTFTLPVSHRAGPALLQIIGQGIFNNPIATGQLEVDYVDRGQPRPKSILTNRDWWKKPLPLRPLRGRE